MYADGQPSTMPSYVYKIGLAGQPLHRVVSETVLSWADLRAAAAKALQLAQEQAERLTFTYVDSDGDTIAVQHEADVAAIELTGTPLRLTALLHDDGARHRPRPRAPRRAHAPPAPPAFTPAPEALVALGAGDGARVCAKKRQDECAVGTLG